MRIWTEAAKAAQREAIRRWRPWAKSTGPKTPAGKAVSSRNACKPDSPAVQNRRTRAVLRTQRLWMRGLALWRKLPKNSSERTIIGRLLHELHLHVVIGLAGVIRDAAPEFAFRQPHESHRLHPQECDFRVAA